MKEDKYPLHDHKYISKIASVTSVTSEIPKATNIRITVSVGLMVIKLLNHIGKKINKS